LQFGADQAMGMGIAEEDRYENRLGRCDPKSKNSVAARKEGAEPPAHPS
tara:strand:- start:2 stop:148 length:147 start_codon:yes stop_codon:yes gene_type:complete